VFEIKQQRS